MQPKVLVKLIVALEGWLEENDADLAVDVFFGHDTAEFMAKAASAVYDAVVEAQRTAILKKNLKEVK